jgi:hypothetical protein
MEIQYIFHARLRLEENRISEKEVEQVLLFPEVVADGHSGRKIFQRKIGEYTLRVVVEEEAGIKRVITAYFARSARYAV